MEADEGSDKEVAKRVKAGWGAWRKVAGIMCDRRVRAAVKGKMFRTMSNEHDYHNDSFFDDCKYYSGSHCEFNHCLATSPIGVKKSKMIS